MSIILKVLTLLVILFTPTLSFSKSKVIWKCSDKIKMNFVESDRYKGSSSYKNNTKLITYRNVYSLLTFDIDDVDSVQVFPVKFNKLVPVDERGCSYGNNELSSRGRTFVEFDPPFNGHRIWLSVDYVSPEWAEGLRIYRLVVKKKVNGIKTIYYKNFIFRETSP